MNGFGILNLLFLSAVDQHHAGVVKIFDESET
jgi:hypothetical protein